MRNSWLATLYLASVCLLSVSYVREITNPAYRGFPLFYGVDESHYVIRLQEGLLRGDTTNGIFSGPDAPGGMQPGGMERFIGALFSWTGWSGTTVAILLSVLIASLTLPIVTLLACRAGCKKVPAVIVGVTYCFLFLGPLRRFVHQSWSFPLTVLAFLLLTHWWQQPTRKVAVVAGIFLGLLPHVYLWSWTFAWTVLGILCLTLFLERPKSSVHLKTLPYVLIPLAVVSVPYFLGLLSAMSDSLSSVVAERSSVVHARGVESFARSVLTIVMALSALSLGWRVRKERSVLPFFAAGIACVIVLHQQMIHGTVISFSTHYYPYIALTAILLCAVVLTYYLRRAESWAVLLVASVLLLAAFVDYRGRLSVFRSKGSFAYQHLQEAYPVLFDGVRETVLTDRDTALVLAANTDDDVVYADLLRHVLISTEEFAERYCMTEAFEPGGADPAWIPSMLHELSRLGRARAEELRAERQRIAEDACRRVREDLPGALDRYAVTMLLWNEKARPDWTIDTRFFALDRRGDGWSIWRRRQS